MKHYQKNNGFTLIELLVVVLIIGILSAIALPQYQKAVWKSRATQLLVFAKHFKDLCTMDKMAGGTCAKLEDMGWEYPIEDYELKESYEQFESSGFTIQHEGSSFTAYLALDKGLNFNVGYPNIYCQAPTDNEMLNSVCKSLTGASGFEIKEGVMRYPFE